MNHTADIKFRHHMTFTIMTCTWAVVFAFFTQGVCLGLSNALSQEVVFSLRAKDEPLCSLLEKISEASGYQIELSDEWCNHAVSIDLKNTTIHKALRRLLAKFNNTIVVNEVDKKITIIIFDRHANEEGAQNTMQNEGSKIGIQKSEDYFLESKDIEPSMDDENLFKKPTREIFQEEMNEKSNKGIVPEDLFNRKNASSGD